MCLEGSPSEFVEIEISLLFGCGCSHVTAIKKEVCSLYYAKPLYVKIIQFTIISSYPFSYPCLGTASGWCICGL